MKVLLINGSPHLEGCTARGLKEVEKVLHENDIQTEWINVANSDVRGCIACGYCVEHHRCVFNDIVNDTAPKFENADGVVIGTPVYYAGPNGQLRSFLDRLFYSSMRAFPKAFKVGATIVSSRRAGSTSAFDDINKYFTISSMPVASSTYWNEIHGCTPEQVEKDLEGLQTMRNLGRNLTFMIKALRAQKEKEGGFPEQERGSFTCFIND